MATRISSLINHVQTKAASAMSSILDADANQLAEFILLNTVIVIMQL